jgi:hypothetical protein
MLLDVMMKSRFNSIADTTNKEVALQPVQKPDFAEMYRQPLARGFFW